MAKTDHEDVAASAACAEQGAPALQMSLACKPDGRLQIGVMREGSYGEDNTASVANLVVAFLNDAGEQWGAPHPREGEEDGVDMVADGPKGRLRMQIVRVPSTQDHWKDLSVLGHTEASITPDGLADDLILAIRKKVARLSPGVRSKTMLVLDGQNALGYDLPPVLHSFSRRYLAEAQASGFEDVFLLGTMRSVNLLRPQDATEWFRVP